MRKQPSLKQRQGYFDRGAFPDLMTFDEYEELDAEVMKKQTLPYPLSTPQYFGSSKGSSLLTKLVLFKLKQDGVFCYRNNSQGTARKQRDGSISFVPGSKAAKGQGDIFSTINGQAVFWEVKFKKDRMSEAQHQFKANIEKSGGAYYVVRTYSEFLEHYKTGVRVQPKPL